MLSLQGYRKTLSKDEFNKILKPDFFYPLYPFYFKPVTCIVGLNKQKIILNPELILQSPFLKNMLIKHDMKEHREHFITLPEVSPELFQLLCREPENLKAIPNEKNVQEVAEVALFLGLDSLKKTCEDIYIA